jgi:chemotaxis-related protein WspB
MLFLLFQIKDQSYCLEVSRIVEVAPMVVFRNIPHTPPYVSGVFSYRGTIVPVIDLSTLLNGQPCRPLLSTRIILVDYAGADKSHHTLGLLAERVTETISCKEEDFHPPGIEAEDLPFLKDMAFTGGGMVQRVELEGLLPESLQEHLFSAGREVE